MMTTKEKILYHQIHPLKLSVDISTGLFTTCLAWQHKVTWFLILFLIPSVIITLLLVRFADLEWLKNSVFGKYVRQHMTSTIGAIRSAGQIIMWVAAWYHLPILIILGLLIIAGGWLKGLLFKPST